MERIVSGMKCRIVDHKEPFLVSFKRANIEWKKKYKRYLGQSALVLDLLEDNTVMLKMKNGKEYKFPVDCVQRLEEVNPHLNKEKLIWHDKRLDHGKRSVIAAENVADTVFSDEFSRDTTSTSEESKGNRSNGRSASIERISNSKIIRRQSKDLVILTRQTKEFSDLQQLLETFSLQKYYKNLVDEGFETIEYLSHAEMEDLRDIGLKRGHARRLLRVLQEWRSNPNCTFQSISGKLQKTFSQVDSFTRRSSMNSGRGSSISRSSIPEYELFAPNDMDILPLIDTQSGSRNVWNWVSPMSDGHNGRKDEGFIIIPFDQRPLGFGIMSPLSVGSMVSRITDDSLKVKGLDLFLPVLFINNIEIGRWNLEDVAHVISHTDLPFTITFGLQPYLRPGQDVMVRKDNRWHRAIVVRISKRSRKVTVKYSNSSPTLSNTEKISDYNRLKLPQEPGLEGSHGPAPQGQLTLTTSGPSPEKQLVSKIQNTDTKSALLSSIPRNKQQPVSDFNVNMNKQRDVGVFENRKLQRSAHDKTRLNKSCGDIMKPDGKIAIVDVNSMDFSTSSSVEDIPSHAVSEIV